MERGNTMKVRKTALFAISAACALITGAARAEFAVQWAVDPGVDFKDFAYAMVAYQSANDSGYLKYTTGDYRDFDQMVENADITGGNYTMGRLGTGTTDGYSFQAQLYSESDVLLAMNEWTTADKIVDKDGNKAISDIMNGEPYFWTASGFTAVPEPTSALLVLMGLAGLALKRKRM